MHKIYYIDEFNTNLSDENWLLTLDISTLWDSFESSKISKIDFIKKYNSFIISKEDKISKISQECMNELKEHIKDDVSDEDFYTYLDKFYDIFDKYSIHLKCKSND